MLVIVRELGRLLLQETINGLEPDRHELLPRELWLGSSCYSRRSEQTRNPHVATLFGTVILWCRGYRSDDKTDNSIFPWS